MELFLIGLGIGLIPFVISLIIIAHNKNRHKKEMQKIRQMVTQKMDLESESLSQMKSEIQTLKAQNENLRVSLRSMSQKATRKEMTRLQIYERGIEIMSLKAPGFAPAWQTALQESEEEFDKIFFGFKPFTRRSASAKIVDKRSNSSIDEISKDIEVKKIKD
jgi:predicted small secreted protein